MNKKYAKVQSTRRSLIMSILSLMLCFAMLIGTTYAWFTDSVTSGKNKIIAGNLDVELKHYTTSAAAATTVKDKTDLFKVALWEPGVIAYENFIVSNEGNLALKYALNLNVFDKNATTENHDLTEVIKVAVVDGGFTATGDPVVDRAAAQTIEGGFETLGDFQKTGNLKAKGTSGQDSDTYGVVLYWEPTDNDNLYNLKNDLTSTDGQPLFVEFGVNLVATQDTVEADSFDNQYDKTAPLAVMSTPMTQKLANTESLKIVVPEEAESSVKEASVPAAVANAIFDEVFTDSTTSDKSLTLVLNVEEKSKTDTTFNYEIDMDAVIKEVSGSTVIKNETKSVNDLGLYFTDFVEVQMNIALGLENVKVKHNGSNMTEAESKEAAKAITPEDEDGYYNYNANGLTKLWIKSFSPFVVTGEKPKVVLVKQTGKEDIKVSLADFRDKWNEGAYYDTFVSATLTADVDISGEDWLPIGTWEYPFYGTFDGNGKTITGLTKTRLASEDVYSEGSSTKYNGVVFGFIAIAGGGAVEVKDLTLSNVNIDLPSAANSGALIGYLPKNEDFTDASKGGSYWAATETAGKKLLPANYGTDNVTISNVSASGSVKAYLHVGGLIGKLYSTGTNLITNCTNDLSVTASRGGLAGFVGYCSYNTLTIDDCTNTSNSKLTYFYTSAGSSTNGMDIADFALHGNKCEVIYTGNNINNITIETTKNANYNYGLQYQGEKELVFENCQFKTLKSYSKLTLINCTLSGTVTNYNDMSIKSGAFQEIRCENNAKLSIEGEATVSGKVRVGEGATLNITGGSYSGIIENYGKTTINTTKTVSNAVSNNNEMTIYGGTFSGKITCNTDAKLDVIGGTFASTAAGSFKVYGSVNITGGDFTAINALTANAQVFQVMATGKLTTNNYTGGKAPTVPEKVNYIYASVGGTINGDTITTKATWLTANWGK